MENFLNRNLRPALFLMLSVMVISSALKAQNRDISYLSSGGKLNPLQAIMDIRHYTIALDVDIEKKSIQGYVDVDVILSAPTDSILLDLVHLLTVYKVNVNNKPVKFEQKNDKIYITSDKSFLKGRQIVRIEYGGDLLLQ